MLEFDVSSLAVFVPDLGPIWQMLVFFLVPMIPAIVFFAYIKTSTAKVNGQIPDPTGLVHDIKFQLGGAFGAYFVTVLLVLSTHGIWNPPPPPPPPAESEVWHVTGKLVDDAGNPVWPYDMKDVSLYPSPLSPDPRGHFDFIYAVTPTDHGRKVYPTISFSYKEQLPDHTLRDLSADSISLDPNDQNARALHWEKPNRVDVGEIHLKVRNPYSYSNSDGVGVTAAVNGALK